MKLVKMVYQISIAAVIISLAVPVTADIKLASDWKSGRDSPEGKGEATKLDEASFVEVAKFNAIAGRKSLLSLGFQLYFDERKYYIQPLLFMAKDKPNEVCTPVRFKNTPIYQCTEGQKLKYSCHLFFFNDRFENVGVHRIQINEPYDTYCNAVPAIGVFDSKRNELLVTSQYFPIDRKAASKVSEIGSGWSRMTSLFRLQEVNGKIVVEQDDSCLKNPNTIDTIPDARKTLKACAAAQGNKQ